jgi:hypothetical protein
MNTCPFNQINELLTQLKSTRQNALLGETEFTKGYLCALEHAIRLAEIQQYSWHFERTLAGHRAEPELGLEVK